MARNFMNWLGLGKPADVQPGESNTSTGVRKEGPPSSPSGEGLATGIDANGPVVSAADAGTGGGSGGDAVGVGREAGQAEPQAEKGTINSEVKETGAASTTLLVQPGESNTSTGVREEGLPSSPSGERLGTGIDANGAAITAADISTGGGSGGGAVGVGREAGQAEPRAENGTINSDFPGTAGAGGGAASAGASVVGVQAGSGSNGGDGEQAIVGKGKRKANDFPAGAPSPSSRSRHANGGGGSSASNNSTNPQEKLEEMGVAPEKAAGALSKTDGNLKAALERLGLGDGEEGDEVEVLPAAGQMVRRSKGPPGSSSMFNAVGYTFFGAHNMGNELRQKVATAVDTNPVIYKDELRILGKTKEEYCEYVANPESCSEQIELSILSKMEKIQVTSVDTRTSETRNYGKEQLFERRVFLVFDGIHYDALAKTASLTAPEEDDTRQFLPWDKEKEEMAKRVATGATGAHGAGVLNLAEN